MSAPVCPVCGKQFGDALAVRSHHNAKHKKHKPLPFPPHDDEPSMAELMIEASWKRDAGLPVEDWLLDVLP